MSYECIGGRDKINENSKIMSCVICFTTRLL